MKSCIKVYTLLKNKNRIGNPVSRDTLVWATGESLYCIRVNLANVITSVKYIRLFPVNFISVQAGTETGLSTVYVFLLIAHCIFTNINDFIKVIYDAG